MHPQLEEIHVQLDEVSGRAKSLVSGMLPDDLRLRPEPDCWSVAECLQHLNLSHAAFVQLIADTRSRENASQAFPTEQYKLDRVSRLLNWKMRPPTRIKIGTFEKFQPDIIEPLEDILPRFLSLQAQLKAAIASVDGLELNTMRVQSPFLKWAKCNLYSCFVLTVSHQQRHLWQADNARRAILRDR